MNRNVGILRNLSGSRPGPAPTTDFVEAHDAPGLAPVNHMRPDGELMARTRELAVWIVRTPPLSPGLVKRTACRGEDAGTGVWIASDGRSARVHIRVKYRAC